MKMYMIELKFNVVYRLVSWDSIVRNFSKIIQYPVNGGGGLYCENLFSQIHFLKEEIEINWNNLKISWK